MRILVVDDDPSIVDAIKTVLESRGYEVIPCFSGEEALGKFKQGGIDIAFLDIKMPDMNGVELLKKVKHICPHTRVIMITAYASVDSAVEAMKAGAVDYIRKPFELKDLESTVLGALEDMMFEERRRAFVTHPELRDAFEIFKNWVREGRRGLVISTKKAEELREKCGFKNVEFAMFSKNGKGIHPRKLEELRSFIIEFASSQKNSVILVDDLDYILDQNPLGSVKEFIKNTEKELSPLNAIFILSGNSENIDESELEELEHLTYETPVKAVSGSLSNYIRREIISQLNREGSVSFTTLAKKVGVSDSPKLSFHLRKLELSGLVKKNEEKKYILTAVGKDAARILEQMKAHYAKEARGAIWLPR